MKTNGRSHPIDRFSRHTNTVIEQSLLGLGILMIGVVAAQVFFRYVLNHSLFWSEELARYILVWLTFLGASVAYRRGVHPRIDLFVSRVSPRGARAIHVGTHLVAMAFFQCARHLWRTVRLFCAAADITGPPDSQVDRHAGAAD